MSLSRTLLRIGLALSLGSVLFPGIAFAEETAPPTTATTTATPHRKRIAVVDFEVPPAVCGGWDAGAADRLGTVLSDMLITALLKTGSFDVIERTQLDKLLKEQQLNAAGILDPATAPKAGKMLGVDLILGGKITEFGVKTKKSGGLGILTGGALGVDVKNSTARAAIDVRVINTTTGQILAAEQGTGEDKESGVAFSGTDFSHFLAAVDFNTTEWTESRIGKATRQAVDQAVGKIVALFPVEARVLAGLPDGSAILDAGRFSGVKVGDSFDIIRENPVKDPDTGEVIYSDRKTLGSMQVIDLQDNRCKLGAKTPLPDGGAKKGDIAVLHKDATPAKSK